MPNEKQKQRGKGFVAVVTGGSAGVGRATVQKLAAEGFDVAILARGEDGLAGARRDVEGAGRRALAISVDVSDARAVDEAGDRIERELGPVHLWVNDAMTSVFSPFSEMTAAEYERVTAVTYLGAVNGTRTALRLMRPRNRGKIVQVGSALAYRSIPLQSAYCGAKAAIRGFTDSLRCELEHEDSAIELSMVQLPALNTPQFGWVRSRLPNRAQPVPPIFQPEVAAEAIVWSATHTRREVYVGWPTLKAIVFGAKLFPGIGDRFLARTGYASQQADEPRDVDAPDNLFEPVPGDHGAHGSFDARAKRASYELSLATHPGAIALALCAVVCLCIVAALLGSAHWL